MAPILSISCNGNHRLPVFIGKAMLSIFGLRLVSRPNELERESGSRNGLQSTTACYSYMQRFDKQRLHF
jgi:hypothetical protein